MREIEIYSGVERIGWDVGVSRPREKQMDIEDKLNAILGQFE